MIEEIFLQLRSALKDDALVYYGGPPHEASSSSEYPCCILKLESEDSTPNETLNTRVVQVVFRGKEQKCELRFYD